MFRNASRILFGIVCATILTAGFVGGCGDSTEPEITDDNNNGTNFQDVPSVPKPAAPGGETGTSSDTLSVIAPLKTHYRPVVTAAIVRCAVRTRCSYRMCGVITTQWDYGDWISLVGTPPVWSDRLVVDLDLCVNQTSYDPDPVDVSDHLPLERMLLVEDGAINGPSSGTGDVFDAWVSPCIGSRQDRAQCELAYTCAASIDSLPYIRRDRFWVRRPLEGGVGNFLLLIGDTQGEITTSYTSGTSTTETEEFGKTVTASAGLSFGALSFGVEVSISQTFSTSVTISEETTESFTKTVFGEDGKVVHFQVWELVERYTITDKDGAPFTDPNYKFEPVDVHIRGVAIALDATKFDD